METTQVESPEINNQGKSSKLPLIVVILLMAILIPLAVYFLAKVNSKSQPTTSVVTTTPNKSSQTGKNVNLSESLTTCTPAFTTINNPTTEEPFGLEVVGLTNDKCGFNAQVSTTAMILCRFSDDQRKAAAQVFKDKPTKFNAATNPQFKDFIKSGACVINEGQG